MGRNKKIIVGGVLVFIVGLIALLFYLTRPIKIGVIFSPETALGTEANLAVRFYRNQFPRIGLKPVKFTIIISSQKKQDILSAYRELESENVSVIIGGEVSQSGIVLSEEAKRSGIPTFGITSSSHLLNNKADHFYRIVMSTDTLGKSMVRYLQEQGISRLTILTSLRNKPYGEALVHALNANFPGETMEIPFESSGDAFQKLWGYKPDAVFAVLPPESLIRFLKEVNNRNLELPVISSEWGMQGIFRAQLEWKKVRSAFYGQIQCPFF